MTRGSLLPVLLALALGGCTSANAPAPPETNATADVAAVNALREAFVNAYNAGDAGALGNLYTADGVSQSNNQPTLTGRDAIIASQKAMFEQVSVKLDLQPEETRTEGTTGYDRGHYTVEVTPKVGGSATTTEGRYLVLLVKEADGAWKVSRDMDNIAGAPPAAPASTAP